jgi:hypothetical protein
VHSFDLLDREAEADMSTNDKAHTAELNEVDLKDVNELGESIVLYITRAANLSVADSFMRSSDPYCIVKWNKQEIGRTPIINRELNPVWKDKNRFDMRLTKCDMEDGDFRLWSDKEKEKHYRGGSRPGTSHSNSSKHSNKSQNEVPVPSEQTILSVDEQALVEKGHKYYPVHESSCKSYLDIDVWDHDVLGTR